MVAKRTAELTAMAARMTEAEFVELTRLYLIRRWGDVEYAAIIGHAGDSVPDHYLRIIPRAASGASPSRPLRRA